MLCMSTYLSVNITQCLIDLLLRQNVTWDVVQQTTAAQQDDQYRFSGKQTLRPYAKMVITELITQDNGIRKLDVFIS